jgi:hypothetical protein
MRPLLAPRSPSPEMRGKLPQAVLAKPGPFP